MDSDILSHLVMSKLAGLPVPAKGTSYQVELSDSLNEPAGMIYDVIFISTRFLTFLWWASCLYYLQYRALYPAFERQLETGELTPLIEIDARIEGALYNYVHSEAAVRHPEEDAQVERIALARHQQEQIESLFLRAVAWVIYHETAHIDLEHERSTPENEFDADEYALSFIENWPSEPDSDFTSYVAMVTATIALMRFEKLPVQPEGPRTHPPVHRRLVHVLDQMGLSEDSDVYLFAATMVRGELVLRGIDLPDGTPARSPKESFENHLAKLEDASRGK